MNNRRQPIVWTAVFLTAFSSLPVAMQAEPPAAASDRFKPAQRNYWAYRPLQTPVPPPAANPIDGFIAAKLAEKGIRPSPEADRVTLLRRAYFDLTGQPPTVAEVDAFVADRTPDAFEKVVDRLLGSPRYGERWARHWLDLARYAESDGFRADDVRPNAWRYRDYVIQSFNANKPYDRFVQEQIAGDEMWPDSLEARVATAFHRNYPDEYNAQNLRQRRQQILDDVTDTVGAVFLGMTFECARCHDHKFDPILHTDYYRLQSFFSNVAADDEYPMLSKADYAEYQKKLAVWEEKTAAIRAEMSTLLTAARAKSKKARYMAYVDEVQQALDKPLAARSPIEVWMADKAKYFINPADDTLAAGLKGADKEKWTAAKAKLDEFKSLHPGPLPKGTGLVELTAEPIPSFVMLSGAYNRPGEPVHPGFPAILGGGDAKAEPPAGLHSTGRRTALAKWLTSPVNPLPARVMANRIWHYHFGRGIVATPSDFGIMGERRTHPELLEWLTAEFIRSGWDIKHMHRLIMTSNAYRQSSAFRADAAEKDPANQSLWRYERRRLEGESVRDTALTVAGVLNPEMFGPSVKPPLPKGVPEGVWKPSPDVASHRRRSIYTFLRRNSLYPMLDVFDMPDTHNSCGRRGVTTTAIQALTYLNNEQTIDWARAFAARVLAAAPDDPNRQVETAYRLAYSRRPAAGERDAALTFLQKQARVIAARKDEGGKLALPDPAPPGLDSVQGAVLVDFCHAILNSSEFVYIN